MAAESDLKAKGIDEVIVYCVNDAAVMKAWAVDQKISDSFVSFAADKSSALTEALGLVLDNEDVVSTLGNKRCKRSAIVVDNGVVKAVIVSEGENGADPAGDDNPHGSCAEAVLKIL